MSGSTEASRELPAAANDRALELGEARDGFYLWMRSDAEYFGA